MQYLDAISKTTEWFLFISKANHSVWRRAWQPTLVFLPEESHGQRSLVGYSSWGCKESDMTERISMHICCYITETNTTFLKQFSSVAQSCPTLCNPWTAAHQGSLSITNSWSLLKFMSIESVMPSNYLILCRPLLLLPSIFSSIRVFSNVSSSHQVTKVLEFQLQHQSFQWIFRTDFL